VAHRANFEEFRVPYPPVPRRQRHQRRILWKPPFLILISLKEKDKKKTVGELQELVMNWAESTPRHSSTISGRRSVVSSERDFVKGKTIKLILLQLLLAGGKYAGFVLVFVLI
jgi:hypothetical protein